MAQKTVGQRTVPVARNKPLKAYLPAQGVVSLEIEVPRQEPVPETHDAPDDHLWDAAIANSMDAIRELADKALAERRAGRTKKITL